MTSEDDRAWANARRGNSGGYGIAERPTRDKFRPDPAELRAWTARNRKAREEYREHPFFYRGHK